MRLRLNHGPTSPCVAPKTRVNPWSRMSSVDHWHYGAHLDDASHSESRNSLCQRNRLLVVFALDHVVAAELLFRFRKRPIRNRRLPVLVAHGDGAGTWVQLCTCQVMAALLEILYEVSI